ncbi:hypothetical protein CCH79_00003516 [Gambusia affinis]|uniref:Uncharacterized protein n=1 Tax=Gambusia affinis TaxID=33528 RepID=A0A315VC32_GAMAF|nr:hypothetical protein CCH79_00003516 [Gambusia affinis]
MNLPLLLPGLGDRSLHLQMALQQHSDRWNHVLHVLVMVQGWRDFLVPLRCRWGGTLLIDQLVSRNRGQTWHTTVTSR